MQFFRNKIIIGVLCIVLGLVVGFVLIPGSRDAQNTTIQVVRATQDIPQGSCIDETMIEAVTVLASQVNLTESKVEDFIGSYAAAKIYTGDYLSAEKLNPTAVDPIAAATEHIKMIVSVTVPSLAASASGIIQPGDVVMQLGYKLPKHGADAEFGDETEAAVLAFQEDEGLKQDGKYGDQTHVALMDAVADDDEGKQDEPAPEETPETPETDDSPKPMGTTVVITSEGGKVNIRVGHGTSYSRITSVAPGTTFEYVATAANGWHAVIVGAKVGWVSGNYSRII